MGSFDDIQTAFESLELDVPDEALFRQRRWRDIVVQYPSIAAWDAFILLAEHMTDQEYFETVRHLWGHSEGAFEEIQFDQVFLDHKRAAPPSGFMTTAEEQSLRAFSDPVEVYRGCQANTIDGISWTTDPAVAEQFAIRASGEASDGKGLVIRGLCSKDAVIAYFQIPGINESEVVVKPQRVTGRIIHKTVVPP